MDPIELVAPTHPALRQSAAEVTSIRDQVIPYLAAMRELMATKEGAGLAAPQVGLGLRFFISRIKGCKVAINPRYDPVGHARTSGVEGCLTWPGRRTYVARHDKISATWMDLEGRAHGQELAAMDARIFQHETDHLNGITIFP